MSIADQIAVMDHSRIEQVGAPRELYDRPQTPFVMGFLGPVTQLGDALVRPHDIALSLDARPGSSRRRSRASCTSASRCASSSCSATARSSRCS